MRESSVRRMRENSQKWMKRREVGETSLGSSRVRATVTLEHMMTLFHMNDVHQGI